MNTDIFRKVLEAQRDLYLKPGDSILVVLTRSYQDAPVSKVLQEYPHQIVRIPDVFYPGQEYEFDEKLLDGKTVAWLISNISISHASPTRKMIDRGMFLISNPGITPDWPAVLNPDNSPICQENADTIMTAIGGDVGGEIHILAGDNTDLHLMVPSGNWQKEIGKREGRGTNGVYGEFSTSPYKASGYFALNSEDFLTNPLNRVIEEIRLTIYENRISEIEGEVQAKTFEKILKDKNDPRALNLAEFAIGINPAKPRTIFRSVTAEKLIGGIHIAAGTNSICLKETCPDISKFRFGRYNCGVHIDCIKFGASVFFKPDTGPQKGKWITILKNGSLVV